MDLKLRPSLPFPLPSTEIEYKPSKTRLHNFNLPRKELYWGSQYLLKCARGNEIKHQFCSETPRNLRRKEAVVMNLEASGIGIKKGVDLDTAPIKRKPREKTVEKPRFSLSLSKEEIEYDFIILTGKKPKRNPDKRPKYIKKQLDALVPGSCLSHIVPEKYIVKDVPKRRKH